AVKYSSAIDAMTGDKVFNLRRFELDEAEWRIVKDLVKVFKKATTFFSQDSVCTISSVIPTMDRIDTLITDPVQLVASLGPKELHPSVKIALLLAKKTLNRYYSLTDSSEIYQIAMHTFLSDFNFFG
ncbi:hypothetical protein C8J56DRAFT_789150, partial [Mycena floridula]